MFRTAYARIIACSPAAGCARRSIYVRLEVLIKRTRLLLYLVPSVLMFALGCAGLPAPAPRQSETGFVPTVAAATSIAQAATTAPTESPTPTGTPTAAAPTSTVEGPTPNSLGVVIIAQLDATRQILTIYGVTPAVTVVMGGTPLAPPPPPPTFPPPANNPAPVVTRGPAATRAPSGPTPAPVTYTRAALKGKILFKSTRDGGSLGRPTRWLINPDGTGLQKLDYAGAEQFAIELESPSTGIENVDPTGQMRVFGERRCYGAGQTCAIYILDTVLNADLINSNDDISQGTWFSQPAVQAKDPAWSPAGNYIAFASNHDPGSECVRKSADIYKGTPGQKPVVRRLTHFCSGGNVGHPSFSPDGGRLVFWADDNSLRQLFVVDVGATDDFDYRMTSEVKITDGQSQDWDPVWIK